MKYTWRIKRVGGALSRVMLATTVSTVGIPHTTNEFAISQNGPRLSRHRIINHEFLHLHLNSVSLSLTFSIFSSPPFAFSFFFLLGLIRRSLFTTNKSFELSISRCLAAASSVLHHYQTFQLRR